MTARSKIEKLSQPNGYVVSVALTLIAWAARQALDPWLDNAHPFTTFYIAVALACGWSGWKSGLLTALGGLIFEWYLFVEPRKSFLIHDPDDAVAILSYCFICAVIVGFSHRAQRIATDLAESSDRFRRVTAATSDAIYDWEMTADRVWWSGVEKVFGYPDDRVVSTLKWWEERIHPEDAARILSSLHAAIEGHEESWCGEYRFRKADGSYAYVRERSSVVRDASGKATRMVGGLVDISESKQIEQALREKDRCNRLVFNQQFQLMALLSRNGAVLAVNDLALKAAGVPRAAILGKLFWETAWWRDLPEMRKNWPGRLQHAAHSKEPVLSLDQFQNAEGATRWADAAITAVKDKSGDVEFFIVQASDVTERIQAEQDLWEHKALFEGLAESMLDGILMVSPEGKLLFFNQRFLDIWKMPPHVLDAKSDEIALDYAASQTANPEEFRRGVTNIYQIAKPIREELLMKDGRVFDRLGAPVMKDDRHYGWLWTFHEITAHKAAQAALEQKTSRVQLLADAAGQLLSADSPGRIVRELFPRIAGEIGVDVYFNFRTGEGNETLVLDSAEGVAESDLKMVGVIPFSDTVCGTVAMQRRPLTVLHAQDSVDPKTQYIRDLGVRAYSCFPLIVGDRLFGTLSFGTRRRDEFTNEDIEFLRTVSSFVAVAQERASHRCELEQRVAERTAQLQQSIEELEHFSYTITHDMRAPLRAMKGFGEILMHEAHDVLRPEHQDYLKRITTSAQRMDNLIEDALNYSKVVRSDFDLHPVDTEALVRDIVGSYPSFQAPRAEVRIEGHLPSVLANEAGLTQCISNLLTNAVKFVRPGQMPHVTIRSEQHDDLARLWVDDDGIGIEPEYQERIFGMFQRLSRNYEGTGIGLALVRKAAERMGGHIGVESEPGHGSHFWLEFKRCSPDEEKHVLTPHFVR